MNVFGEILIFGSGAAVGAVLGRRFAEKKYEENFEEEVNIRVDELMTEQRDKHKAEREENEKKVINDVTNYRTMADTYNGADIRKEDADTKDESVAPDYEHPEDDNEVRDKPYEISEDENEDQNGYSKECLYYWMGSHTLVDDQDRVVDMEDAVVMLGDNWDKRLPLGLTYIRNEKLKTDYELDVNAAPYPIG